MHLGDNQAIDQRLYGALLYAIENGWPHLLPAEIRVTVPAYTADGAGLCDGDSVTCVFTID